MTAVALASIGAALLALSRTPVGVALLRPRSSFVACEGDARVLYEPGAQTCAEAVVACLDDAVASVEREQLLPFEGDFRIYVCDTQRSLNAYMGAPGGTGPVAVKVLNDVFVSPAALSSPTGDGLREIVTHELSHLHLYQRVGHFRTLRELPSWFQEGLAVLVSRGEGAAVAEAEARGAFLSGRCFTPDERGGYWRPKRAADYGVTTRMFYKQSGFLVTYMRDSRPGEFHDFLVALQLTDWTSFGALFADAFGIGVGEMWEEFLEQAGAAGPARGD